MVAGDAKGLAFTDVVDCHRVIVSFPHADDGAVET